MKYVEFVSNVKTICGDDAIACLPDELAKYRTRNVFLISDERKGAWERIKAAFSGRRDMKIKAAYQDNPGIVDDKLVRELCDIYTLNTCDAIVACGGSGIINTAKLLHMMLVTGLRDFEGLVGMDYAHSVTQIPFITIPSSVEVSSDATKVAVATCGGKLVQLVSDCLAPDCCIVDGILAADLDVQTLAIGCINVLSTALDSYTSIQSIALTDSYNIKAIEGVFRCAGAALDGDRNARLTIAESAVLGGIAMSNAMIGFTSAIAGAINGKESRIARNTLPALLPYTAEYLAERNKEKFSRLLFYVAGETEYIATPENMRAEVCARKIAELTLLIAERAGLESRLQNMGVKREDFGEISERAITSGMIFSVPGRVQTMEIAGILERAY